jgi:manganese/zinc/iron transport system permease protein
VSGFQLEIIFIAVVTAAACAIPGVFLVLRGMAMVSDAISHTVLLGIVIAFFFTHDLNSPLLVFGAALMGVLTVGLIELVNRTRLVKEDAAIGLVFPALFSIAVILISRYAGSVHLDTDAVLLGELAFAPFNRLEIAGRDLGPASLYLMGGILFLNLLLVGLFFKELKLAAFDPALAAALGFTPGLIHYGLMSVVSVTVVGAFETVGSILVVALMIAPPITAYLLTNSLSKMIGLSLIVGAASAVAGYWMAYFLDASIAGSMVSAAGFLFILALLFAPDKGLAALTKRRFRQRWEFSQAMLTIHLFNHEGLAEAEQENRLDHLHEHLRWEPSFAWRVVRQAERRGLVIRQNGQLILSPAGRELAQNTIVR